MIIILILLVINANHHKHIQLTNKHNTIIVLPPGPQRLRPELRRPPAGAPRLYESDSNNNTTHDNIDNNIHNVV